MIWDKNIPGGWRDSTADMALTLHIAAEVWSQAPGMDLWALPGVFHEYRGRNKLWVPLDVAPKFQLFLSLVFHIAHSRNKLFKSEIISSGEKVTYRCLTSTLEFFLSLYLFIIYTIIYVLFQSLNTSHFFESAQFGLLSCVKPPFKECLQFFFCFTEPSPIRCLENTLKEPVLCVYICQINIYMSSFLVSDTGEMPIVEIGSLIISSDSIFYCEDVELEIFIWLLGFSLGTTACFVTEIASVKLSRQYTERFFVSIFLSGKLILSFFWSNKLEQT